MIVALDGKAQPVSEIGLGGSGRRSEGADRRCEHGAQLVPGGPVGLSGRPAHDRAEPFAIELEGLDLDRRRAPPVLEGPQADIGAFVGMPEQHVDEALDLGAVGGQRVHA